MKPSELQPGVLMLIELEFNWYHPKREDLALLQTGLSIAELWKRTYINLQYNIKGDVVVMVGREPGNAGGYLLVLHPKHGPLVIALSLADMVHLVMVPTP